MEPPTIAADEGSRLMRWLIASVVGVTALAGCGAADPVMRLQANLRVCQGSAFPQERVHACSEVIASAAAAPHERAQALIERGAQRAMLGQHIRAVADFGRALRIDPALTRAYMERGAVRQQRGVYDFAVADFDRALNLDPSNMDAARRREAALYEQSQSALSMLESLTERISEEPTNADLWNNRCWARATQGIELEFALSDCNEALRLEPGTPSFLDSRGLVYLHRRDFAAARADYEAALARQPNEPHYRYGLGVARIRLGDTEGGQADIAAAEAADAAVADLYESYGIVL